MQSSLKEQKRQRNPSRKIKLARVPSQGSNIGELNVEPRQKIMDEYPQGDLDMSPVKPRNQKKRRNSHHNSEEKLVSGNGTREDIETTAPHPFVLNEEDSKLKIPYEFLTQKKASLRTIILPHFTWKSINFWLSILMLLLFIILLIVYATKNKSDVAWSCLMFKMQNKFYPRLRYNYELWRIPISMVFHGNISHIVLNMIGIQMYGYFIEWYYGKLKYVLLLLAAMINGHFLSCLTNSVSVSSTASCILYAFLGMKITFFIKYRKYQPLQKRKIPLYCLFSLIFAMNLVVLFVGSNVDIGGHVAGLITGLIFGMMYYNEQQQTTKTKIMKWGGLSLLLLLSIGLIAGCFAINGDFFLDLNTAIDTLC